MEQKKDLKYFMRSKETEVVTMPAPSSFKDKNGNVLQFEVKVLSQEQINKINDAYRKKSMATDKKGNPLIASGQVVWKVEQNDVKVTRHILVEALQYPDLKNKDLRNLELEKLANIIDSLIIDDYSGLNILFKDKDHFSLLRIEDGFDTYLFDIEGHTHKNIESLVEHQGLYLKSIH